MKANMGFALFLLVLLAGCGAGNGVSIDVRHLATVTYAAYDVFPSETMLVVRDQASWQNLWSEIHKNATPPPALPAVDFTSEMVLVAAAGTRPTGGYSIAITDVTESDGALSVKVTITNPGSNCGVTQALTSPVDIAAVPRRDGLVGFSITRKVRNCS